MKKNEREREGRRGVVGRNKKRERETERDKALRRRLLRKEKGDREEKE